MKSRDKAVCLVLFALLLRFELGLHAYSGQGTPPKFGDYEAQRHWMEIAVGTPVQLWYVNTTKNDLSYWGLDYPPLSGYQSWLYGKAIQRIEPQAVALGSSRGYETPTSKTLMRWTVVLSDVVFYLPAVAAAAVVFGGSERGRLAVAVGMLLNPALVLMDHGHFQYNSISLGLAAAAAAAVCSGRHLLGSVLFCCSLNHKQMSLYYAPAFFSYLLGCCLRQPSHAGKVAAVAKLGVTVLFTFSILWLPYLDSIESAAGVLQRIFPTKRGLYEDYVANFWCVSSLVIKWKRLLPPSTLFQLCALTTLAAFLPSMALQLQGGGRQCMLTSLALSAFSFYLFSFQVHEKSILLPLLPLSMMPGQWWRLVSLTTLAAVFSMGPLLVKDGLVLAALAVLTIYACAVHAQQDCEGQGEARAQPGIFKYILTLSVGGMLALALLSGLFPPPARWPYLWDALVMACSLVHFAVAFLHLYVRASCVGAAPGDLYPQLWPRSATPCSVPTYSPEG